MVGVSPPIATGLCHDARDLVVCHLVWPLQHGNVEPRGDVPGDMAMKRPRARVVCNEGEHRVRTVRSQLRVTTLRVLRPHNGTIPLARAYRFDQVVVPVQMHRVRSWGLVVDDDANRLGCAKVLHVPLRVVWVAVVPQVGQEQDWVVVVAAECRVVHVPEILARPVLR